MGKIYLSNNTNEINKRISSRINLYQEDYTKSWQYKKPTIKINSDGERVLYIDNLEVMADFETPYMKKLAEIVTVKGGNILNIGYGLGIVDQFIENFRENNNIREHHIIELNNEILKNAENWLSGHQNKDNIYIHKGDWNYLLGKFNFQFDGILYDAFPLKKEDLCRDFIPFLEKVIKLRLLKEGGVITFFLDSSDGFSSDFVNLCDKLIKNKLEIEKTVIQLPQKRKPQGWEKEFFLAPKLTILNYKI